jgi:hypothetical protein
VLLAAALAVLVTVGDPDAGNSRGSLEAWMVVAVVMGPVLVLCVVGARVWSSGSAAPVLLAVVAGSSLALFAVLTKGAVGAASGGFGAFLLAPESYCLIPAALAGMIFQQSAFRAGALTAADGDRRQTGGGLAARRPGAAGDAEHRRPEGVRADRRRGTGDRRDNRPGPR